MPMGLKLGILALQLVMRVLDKRASQLYLHCYPIERGTAGSANSPVTDQPIAANHFLIES